MSPTQEVISILRTVEQAGSTYAFLKEADHAQHALQQALDSSPLRRVWSSSTSSGRHQAAEDVLLMDRRRRSLRHCSGSEDKEAKQKVPAGHLSASQTAPILGGDQSELLGRSSQMHSQKSAPFLSSQARTLFRCEGAATLPIFRLVDEAERTKLEGLPPPGEAERKKLLEWEARLLRIDPGKFRVPAAPRSPTKRGSAGSSGLYGNLLQARRHRRSPLVEGKEEKDHSHR
eukprot:scaffold48_cov311-Pinguiococcus_pyrenoidosus.AAC.56